MIKVHQKTIEFVVRCLRNVSMNKIINSFYQKVYKSKIKRLVSPYKKNIKNNTITILKYDGIGDFILFLDAAKGLRNFYANKKIILSCPISVREIAKKLEISEVLDKYPYQISGGQKQRCAAARAVITSPSLVLADEPTGALDSKSARQLLEIFEKLNKELNTTILVVTHDAFTASYANRILFIKDGKLFNEIIKGDDSRKEFFEKIIDVQTLLGGELNDVI